MGTNWWVDTEGAFRMGGGGVEWNGMGWDGMAVVY